MRIFCFTILFLLGISSAQGASAGDQLIDAVKAGNLATTRSLLAKGVSPDTRDKDGYPALAWAALRGHTEIVRALLDQGADPNLRDQIAGYTPLMHSVSKSKVDTNLPVIQLLIARGAEVNARDNGDFSPLMRAAQYNETSAAVEELVSRGADVNAKSRNGWTPLLIAIQSGRSDSVRFLLGKGADSNAREPMRGLSALAFARKGRQETIVNLLERESSTLATPTEVSVTTGLEGPDLSSQPQVPTEPASITENRPTDPEVRPETVEIKTLPAGGGEDVNLRDDAGWTRLMYAAAEGNAEHVQLLLNKSATVEARNPEGWTALMLAAYYGHNGITQALIDRGADVNARSDRKTTPLIAAAGQGHSEIVQLLLSHRAYPNARDNEGKSALDYAKERGFVTIVSTLRQAGATD
jgi:uncharacterized protein